MFMMIETRSSLKFLTNPWKVLAAYPLMIPLDRYTNFTGSTFGT